MLRGNHRHAVDRKRRRPPPRLRRAAAATYRIAISASRPRTRNSSEVSSSSSICGCNAAKLPSRGTSQRDAKAGSTLSFRPPGGDATRSFNRPLNAHKSHRQLGRQALTGCGEFDVPVQAAKQLAPDISFKRSNMPADRRLRHVKFVRCGREAQAAGRRLKSAQRKKRRRAAHRHRMSLSYPKGSNKSFVAPAHLGEIGAVGIGSKRTYELLLSQRCAAVDHGDAIRGPAPGTPRLAASPQRRAYLACTDFAAMVTSINPSAGISRLSAPPSRSRTTGGGSSAAARNFSSCAGVG